MFADRTKWNLESNRLAAALAAHRLSGKHLFDLTASNPTECGFKYDENSILQALSNPVALHYQPDPKGLEIARKAVSAYYAARAQSPMNAACPQPSAISCEDIFLTTSTSEAYSFAFRMLCNPGDEIMVPEPSYPLFGFLADLHDVKIAPYPLVYDHGWQIDFPALEGALTSRTRGVIVVHPNNPTGHFCKADEIAHLNDICGPREMAVIADEVFLDFVLGEETAPSFTGNSRALTFTMSGLSKISGLPQMKAAWLAVSGPDSIKAQALARLEVIADTFLSMNAPVQLAIPVFLEQRHSFQKQVMDRARRNLAELDRQLSKVSSCGRLKVEGGWYAVIRVPAVGSDEDFAIELLETKNVYVHPGHFYDFPREGHLVVSLITPEWEFRDGVSLVLSAF
jgi:aspartate/methionine/tyrosine aminotransferase